MGRSKSILGALVGAALLFGFQLPAWGGAGGGGTPLCAIGSPSNKAVKILGTVSVDVNRGVDADFVARLELRHGTPSFFRLYWQGSVSGLSNAEVICQMIDPSEANSTNQAAVTTVVNQMRTAFGLAPTVNFYIQCSQPTPGSFDCHNSVYNDEPNATSDSNTVFSGEPTRGASMADVTIFAQ